MEELSAAQPRQAKGVGVGGRGRGEGGAEWLCVLMQPLPRALL